ncbi:MoxR family ATPase [Candidatus Woesearchaeota archaeon]|nr:MoxR family ATPase [Candidatus Woesearchaeota archaeon]
MDIQQYQKDLNDIKKEVKKLIVGQDRVVHAILRAIVADGHVLIEGLPGTAKTIIMRVLARATGCNTSRIQFTVDLLPTDITGITAYNKDRGFYFVKGPIFANFVLADEINRAPPKVQSALLESMQERQTTIGKETFSMLNPFFVMATQNPIESSGVYPLPEAQMDRFLFKLFIGYPSMNEEKIVIDQNINIHKFEDFGIKPVIKPSRISEMQKSARNIMVNDKVKNYITRIVDATRNSKNYGIKSGYYIEYGASPRAAINLAIAARAEALLNGKNFVVPQYIKDVAHDVLRHRIILTYEGLAKKITTDNIIDEILKKVKIT